MVIRLIATIVVALAAACFNPSFKEDIACGTGDACPPGLSCVDGVCRGGGGVIDAPSEDVIDARVDATVDAAPVACTGDEQCQSPPSPCHRPGTCDVGAGVCVFGAVDCSSLDGECSVGVCQAATGSCVAEPINQGNACGAGPSCGTFSPCAGFEATCDASGTQSRTCTRNTCQAGTCTAESFTESAACSRETEGVDCADDTVTGCGECGSYADTCDEGGSQGCTCTDFKCRSEVCTPAATSCTQACARDTDGTECAPATVTGCSGCQYGTNRCAETAPNETCTCSTFSCVNGGCAQSAASCPRACTRDTDGNYCGCVLCGANGEDVRRQSCVAGTCRNSGVCALNGCDVE